ncbi:MAG: hypothetical protein PW788_13295 [Micavibrio sp.]|nr:hypothetical protein [Micavibrio sp.]
MPHDKPKSKNAAQFEQAVAGSAYYSIFSIEPAPDDVSPGKWEVLFYVSGSKDDVDVTSPLKTAELHRLLKSYYIGTGKEKPLIEGELSKNLHLARVDTKERAERLASELVYIFRDAGLEPMKAEAGAYQPMAPETSRPKPQAKPNKKPPFGLN